MAQSDQKETVGNGTNQNSDDKKLLFTCEKPKNPKIIDEFEQIFHIRKFWFFSRFLTKLN